MKTFILSKKDLTYLTPLDATMNGLNVAIQVYVINSVFKRLSIEPNSKARYDLDRGEVYVMEEKDFQKQREEDKEAGVVREPGSIPNIPKRDEAEKSEPKKQVVKN